jgi:hypothetical protein
MSLQLSGSGAVTGVTSINTDVSDTEIGYLDGVTSALQSQLGSKLDLAGGKILQVVFGSTSTAVTNNTNTFADTGLTATITPVSASNKVLILVQQANVVKATNDTSAQLRLLRDATNLLTFAHNASGTGSSATNANGSVGTVYLDAPNTALAVTYKTQFISAANNAGVTVQLGSSVSTIILMEVSA